MIFGAENFKSAFTAESTGAPAWVGPAREQAQAVLLAQGLPTRSQEAWKYTNLALLTEGTWELGERLSSDHLPERTIIAPYLGESSAKLIVINGKLIAEWSTALPKGVTFKEIEPVSFASAAVPPQVGPSVGASAGVSRASQRGEPAQLTLNTSLLRDVISIDIAPGTVLEKPIVISTFSFGTSSLTKWSASAPRVNVTVGRGAQVAIVEVAGGEGRTINSSATFISVAQGARVSHARFNRSQSSGVQLGYTQIELQRDAFCETFQFSLSGRLSREDLQIYLNEPGAEAMLDGLYLVDGKRHVDHATTVEHVSHHTTSGQLYKGILNGEARAAFNGRVRIHRDAQQSNAAQLNNTLLLSKRAEIDTKPELEIDADDVKASHGAAIGQIDPEHVFYLNARGIPEKEAVSMLAKGFAQDVAFRIQNAAIRKVAEALVAEALANTEVIDA